MRRLTIKNIGPIKSIHLDLKRINVLIGLQSSGKSTINKIACHCSWVEKEIYINQSPRDFEFETYFENQLIEFHKLEGFMNSKSFIEFETDFMHFSYSKKETKFSFKWKSDEARLQYRRTKTLYIPAERNIVAVIPNWFDIRLDNSNLRSFMSAWQEARNLYNTSSFPILNLGVEYVYNKKTNTDQLTLTEKGKKISLRNASSGLQSLIPLCTLIGYTTKEIFIEKNKNSIHYDSIIKELRLDIQKYLLSTTAVLDELYKKNQDEILNTHYKSKLQDWNFEFNTEQRQSTFEYILNHIENTQQSSIFLEEPEVNLFPTTQRELVKYLIQSTYHNEEGRTHDLFITTHSPYILTTLNNLIYAHDCAKNSEEVKDILAEDYWINFDDVGVWFVKNGTIECILDQEERQIDATKIDEVSQLLNDEFDNLLNTQYHEV